ncbi:TMEM175 family protein [Pseudonocardia xinjiangensis]|uniref:TMEM175 family protein n=1 Tax=Pseudonocardia xinjiangensis TaxID=75289 RepID=UPI003D8F63D2
MEAPKPLERLTMFTDAVVAIAITLLVLPLVDAVGEAAQARVPAVEMITDNQPQIYSFLLSFVVIARFWLVHRRLFDEAEVDSRALVFWNMAWLLTIVVLPFPTEMIGVYGDDRLTVTVYVGAILASSICQAVLAFIIRGGTDVAPVVATTAILVVALPVAALVPGVHYFALLLLLLTRLVTRAVKPLLHRMGVGAIERTG